MLENQRYGGKERQSDLPLTGSILRCNRQGWARLESVFNSCVSGEQGPRNQNHHCCFPDCTSLLNPRDSGVGFRCHKGMLIIAPKHLAPFVHLIMCYFMYYTYWILTSYLMYTFRYFLLFYRLPFCSDDCFFCCAGTLSYI